MRKTLAVVLAGLMALSVAGSVAAKPGKAKGPKGKNLVFIGLVAEVTDDGVDGTDDSLAVAFIKGNKHARDHVGDNPGDVVVAVTDGTKLRWAGTPIALSDLRPGDGVRMKARGTADGLVAKKVRFVAHRYHGTVESYDPATGMGTMVVGKTNRVSKAYLASLGDPASVPFMVTPGSQVNREGGGDLMAGDEFEMRGRPTSDGTGVELLRMNAAPPSA